MNPVIQRLIDIAQRHRLPHGLLFTGSENSEARSAATTLAQYLFCSDPARSPCGQCLSCRKVNGGSHPDFLAVQTEKQEIKIEQVRDLQRWLAVAPNEAGRKIGWIDRAHLLNAAASNALLKTLEEPPPHALLILSARNPDELLPTIRSRLQMYRFQPSGGPTAGPAGEAPEWSTDLQALLADPAAATPERIFEFTELASKDRESLRWFFDGLENTIRLHLAHEASRSDSSSRSRRLERLFDRVLTAEKDILRRYGNAPLALDRLLLEWADISGS
ncbi:MAG TPA: hypothetical protein VI895_08895 [Bdellovibrionota bacterium]|nr:hypothetical protein [Bdellovibrionota bacterium]